MRPITTLRFLAVSEMAWDGEKQADCSTFALRPYGRAAARLALLAIVAGAAPRAQVPAQPTARFSSQVNLIEVYASATDSRGEPVRNLTRDDFALYEDGERQAIDTFSAGEFPLTVALAVDRSVSMAGAPLALAKQAARTFLTELGPEDRSMVIAISNRGDVVAPLGTDRSAQIQAVNALDAWSTTALRDTIVGAIDRLASERGRRALVLFSDGVDRYSETSAAQVLDTVRRSGVIIYAIAVGRQRPAFFAEAAVLSGGRSFLIRDARQLEATLAQVARELRFQYLLGYASSRPIAGAGEWRSIRVQVHRAGLQVRARDGYLAR